MAKPTVQPTHTAATHANEDLSVAPMLQLPALLAEFGVEWRHMLHRNGIDPALLADQTNRITIEAAGRLLVDCAAETGCPHFGLLVGQRAGASAPGVPAALLDDAGTVGEALEALSRYLHVHDRAAVLALVPMERGRVRLSYLVFHPGTPGAALIMDAVLAVMVESMRSLCGPAWRPTEAWLPRSRPQRVGPYRACLRATLRFDSPHAAIVFPTADLERRPRRVQPEVRRRVMHIIETMENARPDTTSERVVRELSRSLLVGAPSGARIAATLGISRRRLHERLAAEGTRYSELLADIRCEIARQLLEGTRMPAGEIATALHYSSPGAFSRAFRAWTGMTPREVRLAGSRAAGRPPAAGARRSSQEVPA